MTNKTIECPYCWREFPSDLDDEPAHGGDGHYGRLSELSAAIRRGDRCEAELLLDMIAADLGSYAQEQVWHGRQGFMVRVA